MSKAAQKKTFTLEIVSHIGCGENSGIGFAQFFHYFIGTGDQHITAFEKLVQFSVGRVQSIKDLVCFAAAMSKVIAGKEPELQHSAAARSAVGTAEIIGERGIGADHGCSEFALGSEK